MTLPRIRPAVLNAPDYGGDYLSDDGVRLRVHRNECALPAPPHVVDAVRAMGGDTLRYYPAELQRSFAAQLGRRIGTTPDKLALAGGADEILGALGRTFLDAGDNAIIARPTFGMYTHVARTAGAIVREVPYEKRWEIDPRAFTRAADDRTRLVILGHSNNPTGDPLRAADAITIASELPNAAIAIDEVYLSLSPDSLAPIVSMLPNIIVIGSLSKIAALAGMRIGYAIASQPVAAALRRAIQPFPVSAASLVAANAYICGGAQTEAFDTALVAQINRSLHAIVEGLGGFASATWRGPANFVLMDFGARAGVIESALAARGIAARSYAEPELRGCLRFCAVGDAATAELISVARSAWQRETVSAG